MPLASTQMSLGRIMADLELISYVTIYQPIDPFRLSCCCTEQPIRVDYKVLQLLQSGHRGKNVLTLTSCVLRSDRTESFWMATDLVKCLVHSICLLRLRKKLQHLAGCCCYDLYIYIYNLGGGGWRVGGFCLHLWSKWVQSTVWVCVCVCVGGGGGLLVCVCLQVTECKGVCVLVCVSFTLHCMTKYK